MYSSIEYTPTYAVDEPELPMGLEVLDAESLYNARSSGERLYVTYANGRYWVKSRLHDLGGYDWVTHFEVSRPIAQHIIAKGYADWGHNVDLSVR